MGTCQNNFWLQEPLLGLYVYAAGSVLSSGDCNCATLII